MSGSGRVYSILLSQRRENDGRDIKQDHNNAFDAVDLLRQRKYIDQNRSDDQDCEIDHGREVDGDRVDRCGHAEDQQKVEDIGADHVAYRQTVLPLAGGDDRSHQFGQRGAERHDRQTDQRLGHTESGGDILGGFYDKISARYDQGDTDQNEHHTFERRHLLDRLALCLVLQCRTHEEYDIGDEDHQQTNTDPARHRRDVVAHLDLGKIDRGDHTDAERDEQQDRRNNIERIITFFDRILDRDGLDHSANAQYHEEIEQVRADNVAQRDLVRAVDRGRGADSQLGSAGTHCDDGQADDDRRHLEDRGDRRAAVHKQVSALDQRNESQNQQNDLQYHFHIDTSLFFHIQYGRFEKN